MPLTDARADRSTVDWLEANRRLLSAEVAAIAARLRRHAASESERPAADRELSEAQDQIAHAESAMPSPAAIEILASAFGLSRFEREVVLLCAGLELEGRFAIRCAEAQGDPHRPYPTFGLAMAALSDPHWSALVPSAPLRAWRLIELAPGDRLTTAALRIDERVLHHLTGVVHLDERLQGRVVPVRDDELSPSHQVLARRIAAIWSTARPNSGAPVIQLWGAHRADATAVAAEACRLLGLRLWRLRAADIDTSPVDREVFARLWSREAVLSSSALLVDVEDGGGADEAMTVRSVARLIDRLDGPVIVAAREPVWAGGHGTVRIHVARNTAGERRAIWTSTLGPASSTMNGQLDAVIAQFDLDIRGIRAAATEAVGQVAAAEVESAQGDLADAIWDSCRSQARTRLDDLAERIRPSARWDDLVAPEIQTRMLHEIVLHVRNRTKVYDSWGFAGKSQRGLGISALFVGPSGTGKTMAAEVLANELRLDLYRIDLSQVVSKYIGETEKNLRRVFDAAETGGSLLLFDEADALFGRRSEVKDSHDRYANIEVSYLLQRMESYRGLAILTTNMKSALDGAFLRRLRFVVQFPFPDQSQRAEIWRRIFPIETPVEGLDVGGLARLNVAGGNIRSIAMHAAFLAAEADSPVRMAHVLQAARSEYAKLEKPLTDSEVRGWT
jgi:AAA+ superfamily predicted ATPase